MAGEAFHVAQAQHNEAFLALINRNQHGDWAVTVLFYAALHLIDAYLAKAERQHPGDHFERRRQILANPRTKRIWDNYRRLQERSRESRYDGVKFSAAQIEALCKHDYAPVKMECSR